MSDSSTDDARYQAACIRNRGSSRRLAFRLTRKVVGTLPGAFDQKLLEPHRRHDVQSPREIRAAEFALADVEPGASGHVQMDPTGSATNRHEQVAACRFVSHLRRILDVNMDEA